MRYGVILADPPWAYRVHDDGGATGAARNHYPTMALNEVQSDVVLEEDSHA